MNHLAGGHERAIHNCLQQWGEIQDHPVAMQWDVMSRNARGLFLHAHLSEDWFLIRADINAAAGSFPLWSALACNGRLEGTARFVLDQPEQLIHVRAEIPMVDAVNITTDLVATLAGFEQAALLVHDPSGRDAFPASKSAYAGPLPESTSTLAQLLADTGWTFTERAGGSCMVELENKDDFHQALVKTGSDGSYSASVELVSWDAAEPATREALAVLLLTTSGIVRAVRPVVEDCNDRIAARFEIRFSSDADSAFLDRVLSSLSVACRLCSREAAILKDLRIAEKFLAVRNFTDE